MNTFLIERLASDKSTSDIKVFGNGVKRVSSSDFSNGLVTRVRSESVVFKASLPSGKPPSHTPVIVVTPVTVISFVPTTVTLAKFGSLLPMPNFNIFPTLNLAGNCGFELVIVLNPVVRSDLFKSPFPKTNSPLNFTSPVNVLAKPTSPLF